MNSILGNLSLIKFSIWKFYAKLSKYFSFHLDWTTFNDHLTQEYSFFYELILNTWVKTLSKQFF
jgi:hypothetical protein